MYNLLKKFLFLIDPEKAHHKTLHLLDLLDLYRFSGLFFKQIKKPVTVMGIEFPNPVGLSAGMDNNADHLDALGKMGFGFIEVGGVTPYPQEGNEQPRIFRLKKNRSIINRMGFANKGIVYCVDKIIRSGYNGILGINLAKGKTRPNEEAMKDYFCCMELTYKHVNYITINISSPNTPGLRELQSIQYLANLLQQLKKAQSDLADKHAKYVPLVIKVAPDLSDEEIKMMADLFLKFKIDGVISGNTTITRDKLIPEKYINEGGGLSGQALSEKCLNTTTEFYRYLQHEIPIINNGGIMSADDIGKRQSAGAKLVQLYSGLIYRGPRLINECVNAWRIENE